MGEATGRRGAPPWRGSWASDAAHRTVGWAKLSAVALPSIQTHWTPPSTALAHGDQVRHGSRGGLDSIQQLTGLEVRQAWVQTHTSCTVQDRAMSLSLSFAI